MRITKSFLFFLTIIIYSLINYTSCTFDNEEDLLKDFQCDTTNIVYGDLTYIFSDICAQCHNQIQTFRGGIEMDTYQSVKSSVNTELVLPAIKHEGKFDMPYQQPKLTDCEISKIEAWINAGMPEK